MTTLDATKRVVVVGASLAGLRACEGLRKEGFGGEIVLIGAEDRFPYDRPPLSKEFLAGKFDESRIELRSKDKVDALGLHFMLGVRANELSLADRTVTLANGTAVSYDEVILATGATPRALPTLGDLDGILTLRTVEDSANLRARLDADTRVVVVGGGFLGMEVASTARQLGCHVTVVEPLATPLGRVVGPIVGTALSEEHRAHGVEILTGVGATEVRGAGRVEHVDLSDGRVLDAQVVVVAVGVIPETGWLDGSGLVIDNGIVCDERLRVAPHVHAAGDVAWWPSRFAGGLVRMEHWTNAAEQGAYVASAIAKGDDDVGPFEPVPYFWSDHFDLKIQAIGLPGPDDDVVIVDGDVESRQFVACYGRSGVLVGAIAFNRPRQLMTYRPFIARFAPFDEALASS